MEKSVDVIVIGGGISGLCAAKLLALDYGLNVIVLEARERVGGRTNTVKDPRFEYSDLGGAYVGPTQNKILRVAKELGIHTYKVYNEGSNVEYLNGKRRVFSGDLSSWNPIAILDYYNMIRTLDSMGEDIPLHEPWNAPKASEWDHMTVKEFFDKKCWTTYAKKRMIHIYDGTMAAEPQDMSLLYYLWYVKSGDGVLRVAAIENAAQERKFIGGSQQISSRIKDKLGDRVTGGSFVELCVAVIGVVIGRQRSHVYTTTNPIFLRNCFPLQAEISCICSPRVTCTQLNGTLT